MRDPRPPILPHLTASSAMELQWGCWDPCGPHIYGNKHKQNVPITYAHNHIHVLVLRSMHFSCVLVFMVRTVRPVDAGDICTWQITVILIRG